ncbi:hypothetical protein GTV32_17620 [Gordonia sp. SID5947]|uniref:MspA family porin n=1 Tax=Gordonia sp. SID5947 TaxID=2690315 RepID=UPI0013692C79|nr:MspA family porin [Gordonia sp. SID5947]MYR08006.1 hypothetical protein [Gordonia sp. SID5947]
MNKNIKRAAVAIAVGVTAMGTQVMVSPSAEAMRLPGGFAQKTFVDGSHVKVHLYDESATIQRPVTNVPTSREVWVSGKIKVSTSGPAKGASVKGGYVVGCQVFFGAGAEGGVGAGPYTDETGATQQLQPDGSAGGGFQLAPGEAFYAPIVDTTSGTNTAYDKYRINDFTFSGRTGGVAYSQQTFNVDGCAGYAQARARMTVQVDTDTVKGQVTIWGKPFSLG